MKNPLPTIWDEIKTLYQNPRDIHRVLMIVPLGAMISHAHYLYDKSAPVPLTKDELISVVLSAVLFALVFFWCFLSGKMHSTIFWRFLFMGGWAGLCHRMVAYGDQFAGVSMYAFVFAWCCMMAVGFFALTGLTKKDFDRAFNKVFEDYKVNNETTEDSKLISMSDRSAG